MAEIEYRSKHPLYPTWISMRHRCNDLSNRFYGARGIRVCSEWEDFEVFLQDMGDRPPGHSIDRIDPDGNYEPKNCRWATKEMQSANQRKRQRIIVEWDSSLVSMATERVRSIDLQIKNALIDRQEAYAQAFQDGYTQQAIAEACDVSIKTVQADLRTQGVKREQ